MSTSTNTNTNTTLPSSSPSTSPTETSQRTEEAKTAFTASLRSAGANYDSALRDRARNIQENSSVLDKQEADVRRATEQLAKQNDQLAKVADQARDGLKEIGDVQNWAELIERDLLVVEETVRLAEERERGNGYAHEGEGNGLVERESGSDKDGKGRKGWFQWW
ncbi:hypothetical protein BDV23DRAFT_180414 [Aspergillus alliaceus]|uniref:Biogenesis of lysosome-related organelles complex 1 subunit 1 n=1 Tax=Petromyces alliaceus TaxID=209559 RepID=A0A5N6G1W9_PETAA|nr:uncharacterized protein BDW43DRAFT_34692 [Aspergillus alliaceus]KAB8235509.1 hypothetical protein BDW43DRAFT_34692 [Aspergillus alliaceus]KAE8393650.1 hypothetical protein BDV23DRAFT_180414 [Aspergillus alliaceus]